MHLFLVASNPLKKNLEEFTQEASAREIGGHWRWRHGSESEIEDLVFVSFRLGRLN